MPNFRATSLARPATAFALATLAAAAVFAAEAGLDAAHSTLVATFKQEGVAVDAPFHAFSGVIHFDPAKPTAATAAIDVQTASFDIGDPAYNAEVAKPAWLDSGHYPQATFRSTAIKVLAPGKLEASGTLTLKGRALAVTVPITQAGKGAQATFDGSLVISRKAFGIGDATWDDVLDDKVLVKFHVVGSQP
jgi:polyisoprenoid-binding protein YceI